MSTRASRKRKLSTASLEVPGEDRSRSRGRRSPSPNPASGFSTLANAVKGLFSSTPDPTDPVINGASEATKPKPWIGNVIRDAVSQRGRLADNVSLFSSFVDTSLFDGGYADDKKYQVCIRVIQHRKAHSVRWNRSSGSRHPFQMAHQP